MVYNNYAARFNQFQNASSDFKGIGTHAWHQAQNPNELAGRVCKLKKGGEAQRLMALSEFVLSQNLNDASIKSLADHLVPRLSKFGLKGHDADRRKKIQQLYHNKTHTPQPKKHAPKAPAKKQAHKKHGKKQAAHVHKHTPKAAPQPVHPTPPKARPATPPPVARAIPPSDPLYARHTTLFTNFHKSAYKGLLLIGNDQKAQGAWFRTSSPDTLCTLVCKLKKGGEAQRLMSLAEFVIKRKSTEAELKTLAAHLVPRLNKFNLGGADAVRRTNIQKLYASFLKKTQPVPVPAKPDYFQNLASYTIQKSHQLHTIQNAQPTILPKPPGISLTACMYEVFSHVLPTWPATLKITDDTSSRTKQEMVDTIIKNLERIESCTITHVNPANRARLRDMYTNIFFNISKKMNHLDKMAPKEREAFIRDVRSFIQNLGTTFYHCSSRLLSDSTRYYLHFVENQHGYIDDTVNCEDAIHQELIKLRRQVYEDAYFSVDTDRHDATTERYMNDEFNRPLGLHLPEYNDHSWENLALKGKKGEIEKTFYKNYTPIRIANQINTLIRQTKNSKNPWFSLIQNFLESKHHGLNWNDIFNFDQETYTLNGLKPQGMELLLKDLNIIKK